ncbi:MAG: hypothetical protein JF597_20840 [Streptomyces sp.]|jgi:hypothetical protein|uniref:hypothetical protein n=1 Tax=Streptomyces sp. TaxID=1931 RepID=UPI0025FCB7CB|nr:hypothetical protein [Streptomyces sp.]MBW8795947.1 hypothetical protein [Streptomyces sp.]
MEPSEPSVRLNARVCQETDSPIGLAYDLLDHRAGDRPQLGLAQAAPQYPAAPEAVAHAAAVARDARGADCVEIAGLPKLRKAFAAELSGAYRGAVRTEHVVVTAGWRGCRPRWRPGCRPSVRLHTPTRVLPSAL